MALNRPHVCTTVFSILASVTVGCTSGSPPHDDRIVNPNTFGAKVVEPDPVVAIEPVHEPCSGDAASRVYDLCVWADPDELATIRANPLERVEIAAQVGLAGERFEEVELELHGNTARNFPKKSYRIRFRDKKPKFDFFGDGPERAERLVLQASWTDPTYARAKLLFDALRALGGLAPRVSHTRLFVNGEYAGLYLVLDRIDEDFLERVELSPQGNLYKAQGPATFEVHADPLFGFSEVTNEDGTAEDLAELFSSVRDTPATFEDFEREIAPRIALDDFDLWHIVMSFGLNIDTFSKNYYLFHDQNAAEAGARNPFRIIHWDADTSFGQFWNGTRHELPEEANLYGAGNLLAARMYAIPEYRARYVARFRDLMAHELAVDNVSRRAEEILAAIEPELHEEYATWDRRGATVESERDFLLEMIALRGEVMTNALAAE